MKIEDDYEWSSHQPLLNLLLNFFKPKLILELGMGIYSTPIFLEYNPEQLICIENNKEWFEYMLKSYTFKNKNIVNFHNLPDDINIGTFLNKLTESQRFEISKYYIDLANEIKENPNFPKLMFVDNYTCCRTLAINNMHNSFDIIVYHDCQPKGIIWYEYYFDEAINNKFTSYILRTPRGDTGCFINKRLKYTDNALKETLTTYSNKYCIEHNIPFEKIYLDRN